MLDSKFEICEMVFLFADDPVWTHPEMDRIFELDIDEYRHGDIDFNVHRVWITNDREEILTLVVKSSVLIKEEFDEKKAIEPVNTELVRIFREESHRLGKKKFTRTDFGKAVMKFFDCKSYKIEVSADAAMIRDENGRYYSS